MIKKRMVLVLCAAVILAVRAQATLIDFTQLGLQQGNLGPSLVIDDLSISALTHIATAGSDEGTIYLDRHYGLGVQTLSGCGSTGISGKGSDQDEALIFDFAEGVSASSLQLGLSQYKANKDEPIITAALSSGSELSFSESSTNWGSAVTYLGHSRITVDVGLLLGSEGIGQNDAVSRLYVKETADHIYVGSLRFESLPGPVPVPEPATVGLLGLGSLALLYTPGGRKGM
jgi:hypothetical protein